MVADADVFFARCRQWPRQIATANSASGRLADATAAEVDLPRPGPVFSSLPIKWCLPAEDGAVVRPCLDRLGSVGCFIQLTKGLCSPLAMDRRGITGREVARVWFYLLPAQIWRYWEPRRALDSGEAQ